MASPRTSRLAHRADPVGATEFDPALVKARRILLVDAPQVLPLLASGLPQQSVILTRKSLLAASMLRKVRPDAIIGPLITDEWDIVDLGVMLESMGFRGDLFALTRPLPRAELVIREVNAVCPALTVRLLETA